jgi:hypothetical protein
VGVDYERVGLSGSPTKVLKVDFVSLGSNGNKAIEDSPEGLSELVNELVRDYIL